LLEPRSEGGGWPQQAAVKLAACTRKADLP
jgi:hypothetical protein